MVNRISDTASTAQLNVDKQKVKGESIQETVVTDSPVSIQNASLSLSTEQDELPAEKVKKMTDSLNKLLETTSTKLRYQYHEKLDKYYVTLVDSQTDEVVREIPNKKLMDIYATMLDFVGILVDEKI